MITRTCIEIYGLLQKEMYHVASSCAEDLLMKYPDKFETPVLKPMLECEWDRFVEDKKIELKGDVWSFSEPVMCFIDGNLMGDHNELIQWAQEEHNYEDFRPKALYDAIAQEAYKDYFVQNKHTFVFLEISIDSKEQGKLVFELFTDICPKTCENFKALCTGEKGELASGLKLHYLQTPLHRIVPNGWIQGGDILHGRGDSGESIFGEVFEDENFAVPHDSRGILGMANKGRHSNGSQFYVTLQPTSWMNCQYVAFGKLVEGTQLLKVIELLPTFNERPRTDCRVTACGLFVPEG